MASQNPGQWGTVQLTPVAGNGNLTLATGGTSQAAFVKGEVLNGGFIFNPPTAGGQGIGAAEEIWIDITGAPAIIGAGGTSIQLLPGQSYPLPGGLTTVVNWIATTGGHKVSACKW